MSTLTPTEFMAQCEKEALDAAAEYRRGVVDMDVRDDGGETACARCDLSVWDFPTICKHYPIGVLTVADTRVYRVTEDSLTFQWTVCPDCSAALSEWVKTDKEATDA